MKCIDCGEEFDPHDSIDPERCQDCWEAYADKGWRDMIQHV